MQYFALTHNKGDGHANYDQLPVAAALTFTLTLASAQDKVVYHVNDTATAGTGHAAQYSQPP
jgi:hypothetical protein